jgi:hypothetical protein
MTKREAIEQAVKELEFWKEYESRVFKGNKHVPIILENLRALLAEPHTTPDDETLARELAKQLFDRFVYGGWDPHEAVQEVELAFAQVHNRALDEACKVVYGMCESDNAAERTVKAIRALKTKEGEL